MQIGRTGTVAVAAFGALPLLAMLLAKSIVLLLVAVGLFGLFGAQRDGRLARLFPREAAVLALAALAWLAFAALRTFDGEPALTQFLRILALVLLGFGALDFVRNLPDGTRERALDALSIGIAVALVPAAIGCVIYYGKFYTITRMIERADPLSVFSTGMVAIAILTPLALAHQVAQGRTGRGIALAGVSAILAYFTSSNAAALGFAVMAALTPMLWAFPRIMPKLVMAGCVAGFILLPTGLATLYGAAGDTGTPDTEQSRQTDPDGLRGSMGHRYYIWRFATERALERPLTGWGLDASRDIPGGHASIAIGKELMPLHPHNATLQLWLELGIPGLLIGAAAFWLVLRNRLDVPDSTVEVFVKPLTMVAVFATMNTTYGIWQAWWLSLLILVLAALSLAARPRPGGG